MHCSTGWRHMYSTSQKKAPKLHDIIYIYIYTERYKHVCHPRVLVTDCSAHVCYCTLYSYSKLRKLYIYMYKTTFRGNTKAKAGDRERGGGSWSRADATKCLSGRKVTFRVNIIWFLLLT